jgi:hypothetical protein
LARVEKREKGEEKREKGEKGDGGREREKERIRARRSGEEEKPITPPSWSYE